MAVTKLEAESNPLKRQTLRNNEYYDTQSMFDKLYRMSKKDKHSFTNLLQYITDERNIRLAYRNIKRNRGSATSGVDRRTIKRWEQDNTENYIKYVRDRLRNYQPQPVRRVEIPKANGKLRPLGIPTIGDRLIQQCIKQVLTPICEAKFHPRSFGFRPNRNPKHAMGAFYFRINRSQCYYVVDIDIKGFFDNVDHSKLLKQMWSMGIRDKNLLSIIAKMLKSEVKGIGVPTKGTPQGSILSPLLSNIVLNEFDWWISDQWETFKSRHEYLNNTKKFHALRKGNLKEMYLVRYADDFKIQCKSYQDAVKIYHGVVKWLKDRLGLEVSHEKSKITNLRKEYSEFLGIKVTTQPSKKDSKTELVIKSHMTETSKAKVSKQLKEHIKRIKHRPDSKAVMNYNSAVLGCQLYYKMATHISLDMNDIAFSVNRVLHNRLKSIRTSRGKPSETYLRFYKNNYQRWYIANIGLFPIADVQCEKLPQFTQSICDYTVEGRTQIHKKLGNSYNDNILLYIVKNPLENGSLELNDNRISLYIAQKGKCFVSKELLQIGNMEVHHKKPVASGGDDRYNNLVFITSNVHKLIHATKTETIQRYIRLVRPDESQLKKINKLREEAGNSEINLTM
ncbi:group II intron reverse transcriptase/maturase [Bacillus altitudinis]|uniref:group II intron reverse transcriptase/maturase n=1 Tax=Bacillus altitudinis TaxID=293387 RepID=UPI00227F9007|nr:group II intron reverse transcriptase/maturase [Bacillus altitudinis]MCY7688881.1 group II intron reverse transcriptase/maturase [Bacillus altitudinis]